MQQLKSLAHEYLMTIGYYLRDIMIIDKFVYQVLTRNIHVDILFNCTWTSFFDLYRFSKLLCLASIFFWIIRSMISHPFISYFPQIRTPFIMFMVLYKNEITYSDLFYGEKLSPSYKANCWQVSIRNIFRRILRHVWPNVISRIEKDELMIQ